MRLERDMRRRGADTKTLAIFVALTFAAQAAFASVIPFVIEVNGFVVVDFETGEFESIGSDFSEQPPSFGFTEHYCGGVADVSGNPITTSGTITWSGPNGTLTAVWNDGQIVVTDPNTLAGVGGGTFTITGGTGMFVEFDGTGTFTSRNGPFDENGRADTVYRFYMPGPVPAVSEWSLIVMTLLGMSVGTVMFAQRRVASSQAMS
ncbi:MAG: hypothetical protein IH987_22045 [Planctomycetes bacterium]|nr:hypothetical protein [Planctomycetota bacterium]